MDAVHQCIQNTHIHNVFSAYGWFSFPLCLSFSLCLSPFRINLWFWAQSVDSAFLVALTVFSGAREVSVKYSEKFFIVIIFNMYFGGYACASVVGRSIGRSVIRTRYYSICPHSYLSNEIWAWNLWNARILANISNFCTAHNCNVEGSIMILSSSE